MECAFQLICNTGMGKKKIKVSGKGAMHQQCNRRKRVFFCFFVFFVLVVMMESACGNSALFSVEWERVLFF